MDFKGIHKEDNAEDLPTAELSIESSLAKELNQLSLQEREKAYYDLHGVADAVNETPAFVTKCLADLEMELSKTQDKKAYEVAKSLDEDYICGREFRLMFLRAETFDSKKAATRLVGFLEEKLKLFGLKPLARELVQSDLNQDDRSVLELGFCSLLPLRDSAGRAITCIMPYFRGTSALENRMRATMYIICTIARDEEIQKKGLVSLFINKDPFRASVIEQGAWSIARLIYYIAPVRSVGTHFCFDEGAKIAMTMMIKTVLTTAQTRARVRFRFHSGSLLETHYTLMTFGIPTQVLPLTNNGKAVWEHHHEWVRMREELEDKKEEQQTTVATDNIQGDDTSTGVPMPLDVVMGNEKFAQTHTGNIRYQCLIDERQERYDSAESRIEKTLIASEIVLIIKEDGGRFWMRKQGVSGWVCMDDWVARSKVATAFRGRRKAAMERAKRASEDPKTVTPKRRTQNEGSKRSGKKVTRAV
jgi:hypothetical protein